MSVKLDSLLNECYTLGIALRDEAAAYADALMRDYTAAAAKSEMTGGEFRRFKGAVTDLITKSNAVVSNINSTRRSLDKLTNLVREIRSKRGRSRSVRIPVRA